MYTFAFYVESKSRSRHSRGTHRRPMTNGNHPAGRAFVTRRSLLLWPGDRQLPHLPAARARQFQCPVFCPAKPHQCFFLDWGHRMAKQLRAELGIKVVAPTPSIWTTAPLATSHRPVRSGVLDDRRVRGRLRVPPGFEARLREFRREVDERRRQEAARSAREAQASDHRDDYRQPDCTEPDVLLHRLACPTQTQADFPTIADDYTTYPPVGEIYDDHIEREASELLGVMEQLMAERYGSPRHRQEPFAMQPTIPDELFQDALDNELRSRLARTERSSSLP